MIVVCARSLLLPVSTLRMTKPFACRIAATSAPAPVMPLELTTVTATALGAGGFVGSSFFFAALSPAALSPAAFSPDCGPASSKRKPSGISSLYFAA